MCANGRVLLVHQLGIRTLSGRSQSVFVLKYELRHDINSVSGGPGDYLAPGRAAPGETGHPLKGGWGESPPRRDACSVRWWWWWWGWYVAGGSRAGRVETISPAALAIP